MKTLKNGSVPFRTLDAAQLKNIQGGTWVEIPCPDGTIKRVWV
jgi:hypothetical protein